jgi:hypothetical protein
MWNLLSYFSFRMSKKSNLERWIRQKFINFLCWLGVFFASFCIASTPAKAQVLSARFSGETLLIPVGNLDLLEAATRRVSIVLRNDSPKAVTIKRFYNPCGCVKASDLGIKELQPQQETRLTLTLELRLMTPGPFQKTLSLYGNGDSSQTALLQLSLQGDLIAPIRFSLPQLDLNARSQAELTFTPDPRLLRAGSIPPLVARTSLAVSGAELQISAPKPADKGSWRCTVSIPENAPIGAVLGTLAFQPSPEWESQHPKEALAWRIVLMPVVGLVKGSLSASPQTTAFVVGKDGKLPDGQREIRLLNPKEVSLTNFSLRASHPLLRVEERKNAIGEARHLRITWERLPPPDQPGPFFVEVRFTAEGRSQRLVIPVSLIRELTP